TVSLGATMGIVPIVLLALILSPFIGYVGLSFWSWILAFTGKWFKGHGRFLEIRAAAVWACVSTVVIDVLWILTILVFGINTFVPPNQGEMVFAGKAVFLLCIGVARLVLMVWSLVIFINSLSEVQHFSVLRTIGNMIVAGIILMVVMGIVTQLVMWAF